MSDTHTDEKLLEIEREILYLFPRLSHGQAKQIRAYVLEHKRAAKLALIERLRRRITCTCTEKVFDEYCEEHVFREWLDEEAKKLEK